LNLVSADLLEDLSKSCVFIVGFIVCLDPENFKEFKLVKRHQLSHNVAKFVFELPTSTSVLGLPIGQHISCRFGPRTSYYPLCVLFANRHSCQLLDSETYPKWL